MKRNIFRHICIALMALMLLVSGGQTVSAQDLKQVTLSAYVQPMNSNKKEYIPTQWTYFRSKSKAQEAQKWIEDAITNAEKKGTLEADEVEKVSQQHKIVWKSSKPNGEIVLNALDGGAVLIYGNSSTYVQEITDANVYECKLNGRYQIGVVNAFGKKRGLDVEIIDEDPDEFGDTLRFNVGFRLAAGLVTDKSRIIVQPFIVDCQTEDTLSYLKPIVFEGADYHKLQDRRMGYDYFVNDSVARGYDNTKILADNNEFSFATQAVYRKPDRKKSYKGLYTWYLEDYHRVLRKGGNEGTCLAKNNFKLIDYSEAASEIRLTSEFQQVADPTPQRFDQNIDLRFKQGSDELLQDSLNDVKMNTLIEELNKYGDLLNSVTIQGGASAEGSIEINTKWANKRAEKALALLRGRLPSDVPRKRLEPRVSTWNDVLAEVEKQGNEEITEVVRGIVSGHKSNEVYGLLKAQPFYETVIEPILVNQRMMKCSYFVNREKVLEPDEAVEMYFRNKKDMLAGKKYMSEGDYYNLFATIRDSEELDTVTMIAYKYISQQPGYTKLKLAPYVANRWALYNLRKGTPNLEILRPFLDLDLKKVNVENRDFYNASIKWKINREEHLINQAVTYFQEQILDTAYTIVNKILPKTERVEKLQLMIDFVKNYKKHLAHQLTDEMDQRIEYAKRTVIDTNVDNRAIIATEFAEAASLPRDTVEAYIDLMADDNPKKWYLKGLLWADEEVAGKETTSGADDYTTPANGQKDEEKDIIPYFLAYFQHSFDLDMEYKRMYFRDGHIKEKLRKKFPYQKKHFDDYRRKFEQLKTETDKKKAYDAMDGTLPYDATPTEENTNTENNEQPSVDANE